MGSEMCIRDSHDCMLDEIGGSQFTKLCDEAILPGKKDPLSILPPLRRIGNTPNSNLGRLYLYINLLNRRLR